MQGERSESSLIPRRIVFLFSFFVASEEGYARRAKRVLANPPTKWCCYVLVFAVLMGP